MCIAADSGIDHARALGRVPDLVVGDFDSVTPDGLRWAIENGAAVEHHDAVKEETDLEIALRAAIASGAERVVAAGVGGGRFDHLLANFAVLSDTRFAAAAVDALIGTALVAVVHDERTIGGDVDELVSLLPVHGDAHGVRTTGLGYPLDGETLRTGASRGVSNYLTANEATVSVRTGTVLAVQPERLSPPGDRSRPSTAS